MEQVTYVSKQTLWWGKKKKPEIFQKFYIDFFHPCLKNYEDMFIRETSVM